MWPLLALLALILVLAVVGAFTWYYLSQILRGTITVREQPTNLLIVHATFPEEIMIGAEFTVSISVTNPNHEVIRGVLLLNITKIGIGPESVFVSAEATHGGVPICVERVYMPWHYPHQVFFMIRPCGLSTRYFYFNPGYNPDVAWIRMYFNEAGQYNYELSVVWIPE